MIILALYKYKQILIQGVSVLLLCRVNCYNFLAGTYSRGVLCSQIYDQSVAMRYGEPSHGYMMYNWGKYQYQREEVRRQQSEVPEAITE